MNDNAITTTETVEQGSEAWHAKRAGKITASRISDMLAKTKTGWGTSRQNYRAQLVAERLTGKKAEGGFTSAAMKWGIDCEPEARDAYAFLVNATITPIDFVDHPTIPMCGASPDSYVGDDGLLEIKCPLTATHISTLLTGKIDSGYVLQMMWQMACTGRAWCDFVSYDPRMPEDMRLWRQRVPRDEAMIREIETEAKVFLSEIERDVAALVAKYRRG